MKKNPGRKERRELITHHREGKRPFRITAKTKPLPKSVRERYILDQL